MKALEIGVACVVDPDQPAVLDPAHRVFVNWETYYMSSAEALRTFRAAPWKYVGEVTDPVSGQRFAPNGGSPTAAHGGRRFYFPSAASAEAFAATPDSFVVPRVPYAGRM